MEYEQDNRDARTDHEPYFPDEFRRRANEISAWLFRLCEVMLLTALFSLAAKKTDSVVLAGFAGLLLVGTMWHAMHPFPKIIARVYARGREEPEGLELWVVLAFVGVTMAAFGGGGIYALNVALKQLLSSGFIN